MSGSNRMKYLISPDAWAPASIRYARQFALRAARLAGRIPQAPLENAAFLPEQIRSDLVELSSEEYCPPSILRESCGYGKKNQQARIRLVAEYCVANYPGDIIEIGCFRGQTTRILAQVAADNSRRVIALDPWETGTQNCYGSEYDDFLKNTANYSSSIDIIRLSSLCEEAKLQVKKRKLCLALVDGLHTYHAALSDIRTVSHCSGPIIVDDIAYGFEVMLAMRHGAHELDRHAVQLHYAKEGYLVK